MRNMTGLKRGGSGGRPKGSPNKATVEIKSFCRNLLSDKAYVTSLRKRLLAGKLAPAFEVMLFAYALREAEGAGRGQRGRGNLAHERRGPQDRSAAAAEGV